VITATGSAVDVIETVSPSVSWRAILGGAVVIAAVAFILTVLGAGFGLASISPWPGEGASATEFAVIGGIWLIVVQWLSAGLGGYMAGRLGPKTAVLHVDEVYFRDTARGIIAWAVAVVITALLLTSAVTSLVGSGARAGAGVVASLGQGAMQGAAQGTAQSPGTPGSPSGYLLDTLFRKSTPDANGSPQDARGEATRIIVSSLPSGDMPAADKAYLAQLVAARTGISQDDAQKRIDTLVNQVKQAEQKAREAADAARKAGRNIAFFTALSLLIGAFVAGVAAKIGGHHRDELV
jgi:hypothetical protein